MYDTAKVNALILWDPTPFSREMDKEWSKIFKYNKKIGSYIIDWGVQALIKKEMFSDLKAINKSKIISAVRDIKSPTKIISSRNSFMIKGAKEYYNSMNCKKSHIVLKNSGHTFSEEGVEEKLFKETLDWVKNF
ncbi:MAG: hypothetical protein HY513_00465 [Candidatus Aenigmarchaeota archaeon]|nr:hypothetical protein [Candidatus Aenigmarchaeota archaeon]